MEITYVVQFLSLEQMGFIPVTNPKFTCKLPETASIKLTSGVWLFGSHLKSQTVLTHIQTNHSKGTNVLGFDSNALKRAGVNMPF